MNKKIAIVVDSACGPQKLKESVDVSNVFLIPLLITTEDGREIKDDENFKIEELEAIIKKNEDLKTSQTPPGMVLEKWDEILNSYDYIINLPISSGLSGQYDKLCMLANDEKYKGRVFVCDTNGISLILYRYITIIQQRINEGWDAEKIKNEIDEIASKVKGFIVVKSLKRLVKGGRVGAGVATLAKVLKIFPILEWNGRIEKAGKARTWKKAVDESIRMVSKIDTENKIIDMGWSLQNEDDKNYLLGELKKQGFEVRTIAVIPAVLTAHVGLDVFAIMKGIEVK
ncbi:DegV family protein [Spiroplasma endosymbiont of Crioceris asparagi]|uniref:DegV family protein n=1 Tax=Spiroplasma endosymbiont of Crioceris asparagi TaxID=3066286 RepID=UPI0030CB8EF1